LPGLGMEEMRGLDQDYLLPQTNGWRPITTPFTVFVVLINISTSVYACSVGKVK